MLKDLTYQQLQTLPTIQTSRLPLESIQSENYKTMTKHAPELAKHVGMVCPDCHDGHLLVATFYTLQCTNPECQHTFEDLVNRIPYPPFRRLIIPLAYIALDQQTYNTLKSRVNTPEKPRQPYYTLKHDCNAVSLDTIITESDVQQAKNTHSVVMRVEPIHVYDQYNAIAFNCADGGYRFGMLVDDVLNEFNELSRENKQVIMNLNHGLQYGQLITYTQPPHFET